MSEVGLAERHYAYPLVTWGSTFLGAAVALITAFMLNVLGAALGLGAAAFFQTTQATAAAGVIGMLWVAIANLAALGFGAWVAGRSTANPDHHGGTLQGIAVWAVTSAAILFLAGSAVAGLGGAGLQAANTAAPSVAMAPGSADQGGTAAPASGQPMTAGQGDATAQQDAAALQSAAAKTATATAGAAFGTFLAMVLGLVAAIFGARAGARHPHWMDRPRFTYVERRH